MAGFIVDDGGDNSDGLTWATAYTSVVSLIAGETLAAGDIVYFGHDSNDANSYASNTFISVPSGGNAPVTFISVQSGTGTIGGGGWVPTISTSEQIDTSNSGANNYTLTLSGKLACQGMSIRSGGDLTLGNGNDDRSHFKNCRLWLGTNEQLFVAGAATLGQVLEDCIIDLTADGSSNRSGSVIICIGMNEINGLTFVNAAFRTGRIIESINTNTMTTLSGLDLSGFTNATTPEVIGGSIGAGLVVVDHSLTPSTHTIFDTASTWRGGRIEVVNVGPSDQPERQGAKDSYGTLLSSTTVYRSGGKTVEGTNVSWGGPTLGIETTAKCSLGSPFYTPWMAVPITATGTYQFDVYIGNNTGDFDDDEVWLEVEYKDGTSGLWTFTSDRIASIVATPSTQTDETSSTWNGDALTFKQVLSVSGLTIGATGLARARVAIGLASIAASRDFYIDPLVTATAS